MGRWSELDSDAERLPEGMARIGYDADTQVYTYRDTDGSIWEGAPGARSGRLWRVGQPPSRPARVSFENPQARENPVGPLPDGDYDAPMHADGRREGDKRPRVRYKARIEGDVGPSARSKIAPLSGFLRLLRRSAGPSRPRREGPRIPPDIQRRGAL